MSIRMTFCLGVACSLSLIGVADLSAQGSRTSSGLFGSRTVGGSLNGGTRNAFGGGGQGQGALEGTTAGNRLDQLIGGDQAGTVTGTERYVRGNRDATQFVGSDQTDTSFIGALTGGASRIQSAMGNLGLMNRNRPEVNTEQRSNRSVNIRTMLTVGFRYPRLSRSAVESSAQEHLNVPALSRIGSIQVEMVDRTATLRGTVATSEDRELAVQLARLEPGISEVVDRLTVSEPESAIESPSDSTR